MKKFLLPALMSCSFIGVNVAVAEVNCEVTPYYGVCSVCQAESEIAAGVEAEEQSNTVDALQEDCAMRPYINGICENA